MTPENRAISERLVNIARWKDKGIQRFTVRVYDMFDGWCDCLGAINVSGERAMEVWMKDTQNGTKNTEYSDGDYYEIFPADTKMLHTPEYRGRE